MSLLWNYYEKRPGSLMANCNLCSKEYSYKTSVTNLKKHLRSKHKSAYENFINGVTINSVICENAPAMSTEVLLNTESEDPLLETTSGQTSKPKKLVKITYKSSSNNKLNLSEEIQRAQKDKELAIAAYYRAKADQVELENLKLRLEIEQYKTV